MPLQFQEIEILLAEGLDQKTDAKSTRQGRLVTAENVEFDKFGALNKRRGYSLASLSSDALGRTAESIFHAVAIYEDELVIFGHNLCYALASKSGALGGAAYIVQRGPVPRGNIKRQDVTQGAQGEDLQTPG